MQTWCHYSCPHWLSKLKRSLPCPTKVKTSRLQPLFESKQAGARELCCGQLQMPSTFHFPPLSLDPLFNTPEMLHVAPL